jgi:hypothetical protein
VSVEGLPDEAPSDAAANVYRAGVKTSGSIRLPLVLGYFPFTYHLRHIYLDFFLDQTIGEPREDAISLGMVLMIPIRATPLEKLPALKFQAFNSPSIVLPALAKAKNSSGEIASATPTA